MLALCAIGIVRAGPPSIIFILTDDQDIQLGGSDHQPLVQKLIAQQGATLTNVFTTTPVCCPSRSSYLSGRYIHNIPVLNNSIEGNCSSRGWQTGAELQAFAPYLHRAGYRTFFAGKYLNCYGSPAVGGPAHVPPGWDRWLGLVGNSVYYDYTLSVDGQAEKHGSDYASDYLPDLIANRSVAFLENHMTEPQPFFMMIAPPSCHDPTAPAPQYAGSFANTTAPRTPSFGARDAEKAWFVADQSLHFGMEDPDRQRYADLHYRRRLSTLLSVDDMVARIVATLQAGGRLQDTFIFYTSDNGYHHGQFGMMKDKRTPYEFDIHLPGYVRGPGITPGTSVLDAITNVDFFPTFLDIAGVAAPAFLDGRSMLGLLQHPPASPTPRTFLVEYSGEGGEGAAGQCARYHTAGLQCGTVGPEMRTPPAWTGPGVCSCEDTRNNTYRCLRTVENSSSTLYCEFFTSFWGSAEDDRAAALPHSASASLSSASRYPPIPPSFFTEYYTVDADPWQLHNAIDSLTPTQQASMHDALMRFATCSGFSCVLG